MSLLRLTQKFYTLSKVHTARYILFLLMSLVSLASIISITGCTDKAAEIRDQECVNMRDLMTKKSRSIDTRNQEEGMKTVNEFNRLSDEYDIKCKKKK